MDIYVVQLGDNIEEIANKYGITVERLISDNGMINPYSLVVGQTIVILYPKVTYIVKQGDTLTTIADSNEISIMQLMRNNPFLYDRDFIYPDESLVISYNTVKDIQVNAYTYVFPSQDILTRALPYLTFISIFNYRIVEDANIINFGDDSEIIRLAEEYDTIPLLMISTLSLTGEDLKVESIYKILLDNEQQDKLINGMLQIIRSKGFKGINVFISNITEYNQSLYLNVFAKLSMALRNEGYIFFITITTNYTSTNENLDYQSISFLVDRIIFLQNIWEMRKQPPAPISDISLIRQFIDHITSKVSPNYISLGKPLVGLGWDLSFIPNLPLAKLLSLNSTITLAYDQRAVIQLDDVSQNSYFNYMEYTENHIVWFIDARSIKALDEIIIEYDLVGTGLWFLTSYNQQLYSIINATFNILKLHDEI